MNDITIRTASEKDAASLLEIYAYYVSNTAVTFEYDVPSQEDFRDRIACTLNKYPYLVAEIDGEIVGYTYAGSFNSRAAYEHSAEVSVYVRRDRKKQGIGKALYDSLEKVLSMQNIFNINACIAFPDDADEFLTKDSFLFHRRMGFRLIGKFSKCGLKFGRWYNMVWMEKIIGSHDDNPPAVKSFREIREKLYD